MLIRHFRITCEILWNFTKISQMPSNLIRRAHQKNIFTSTWGHFFLVSFLPPSLTGRGLSWLKQCSHILWLFCDCNNQITQISNQCRGSCYSQADAFKVVVWLFSLQEKNFLFVGMAKQNGHCIMVLMVAASIVNVYSDLSQQPDTSSLIINQSEKSIPTIDQSELSIVSLIS